jgi:hypothetical protein
MPTLSQVLTYIFNSLSRFELCCSEVGFETILLWLEKKAMHIFVIPLKWLVKLQLRFLIIIYIDQPNKHPMWNSTYVYTTHIHTTQFNPIWFIPSQASQCSSLFISQKSMKISLVNWDHLRVKLVNQNLTHLFKQINLFCTLWTAQSWVHKQVVPCGLHKVGPNWMLSFSEVQKPIWVNPMGSQWTERRRKSKQPLGLSGRLA